MRSQNASPDAPLSGRRAALLALACCVGCAGEQAQYVPLAAPPLPTPPAAVVYLVGDGGEVNPNREAVLERLRADIASVAGDGAGPPVVVAFLGDNVYDEGAQPNPSEEDLEKLSEQVLSVAALPNVHGVFVPGNHDWANGGGLQTGREAVARQRAWVEGMAGERDIRFLPEDGCPGPATEDVGDVVHLVFVDSEWLLRKPEERCGTAEAFYERLTADLRANRDRPVIVLSHHPLESGGPHGGNVALFERGPLLYYLAVKSGSLRQDLASPSYAAMRRGIASAIAASGAPPLIHAGGHDHTLQVIRLAGPDQPRYQLVSGALSKTENARRIEGTRWASNGYGYMRLDFVGDEVRLSVFRRAPTGGPVEEVFGCTLTRAAPADECPEARRADGA